MIRTVWLAIAFLIGLAALTVIKVGTQSFVQEAVVPSDRTVGTNLASDASEPEPLAKSDRLDVAEEDDAARSVKPIAIAPVVAEPAASREAGNSERGWRNSYAKRQASASRHHRGKLHRTSRRHHAHVASRGHGHSKHAMSHKQKKSRRG
jgi:hypothetical protein